jgi:hypothetical protein
MVTLVSNSLFEVFQFPARAPNLLARGLQLIGVHQWRGAREPAAGPPADRRHHLQVPHQFHRRRRLRRRGIGRLPRFQIQLGIFQNPPAHAWGGITPCAVNLTGLPGGELARGKRRGHTLAIGQADTRHRRQTFHCQVRGNHARPHLLLDPSGKQFHQRQPPAHPAGAAVKLPRQILERVSEALLQFGQQPPLFQRRLSLGKTHRVVQHQGFGFAHRPNGRLHHVPAQLLQRRDPLVAVDDQIPVRRALHGDDHDRHLLP